MTFKGVLNRMISTDWELDFVVSVNIDDQTELNTKKKSICETGAILLYLDSIFLYQVHRSALLNPMFDYKSNI